MLFRQVGDQRERLERFTESHFVGQDGIDAANVQRTTKASVSEEVEDKACVRAASYELTFLHSTRGKTVP